MTCHDGGESGSDRHGVYFHEIDLGGRETQSETDDDNDELLTME